MNWPGGRTLGEKLKSLRTTVSPLRDVENSLLSVLSLNVNSFSSPSLMASRGREGTCGTERVDWELGKTKREDAPPEVPAVRECCRIGFITAFSYVKTLVTNLISCGSGY